MLLDRTRLFGPPKAPVSDSDFVASSARREWYSSENSCLAKDE